MKLITAILLFALSAGASANTIYCSNPTAKIQRFEIKLKADAVGMSEWGTFVVDYVHGGESRGSVSDLPLLGFDRAYQGRTELDTSGLAPAEYAIYIKGNEGQLFYRDLTVMGPTGWKKQSLDCQIQQ